MGKLTAVSIKNAPPGKHEDGSGLRLVKRADGGGQWVLRVTVHGRRREMGLGGLQSVSLKDARELATHFRGMAANGLENDPTFTNYLGGEYANSQKQKGSNWMGVVGEKDLKKLEIYQQILLRMYKAFPPAKFYLNTLKKNTEFVEREDTDSTSSLGNFLRDDEEIKKLLDWRQDTSF